MCSCSTFLSSSCLIISIIYILTNSTQINCTILPNINPNSYSSAFNNLQYEEEEVVNDEQQQQQKLPKKLKTNIPDKATLDLSGHLNIHILSPRNSVPADGEGKRIKTIPFIKYGKYPHIHLGFLYDFGLRWYGATKLLSTFTWLSSTSNNNDNNRNNFLLQRPNTELKLTKDLTTSQEDSISIKLSSNKLLDNKINISTEGNYIPSKSSLHVSSTIQTCIKRRFNLIYKILYKVGNTNNDRHFLKESLFTYKVPKMDYIEEEKLQDLNWMVPDLQLGLDGRVISTNECTVPIPIKNISKKKRNTTGTQQPHDSNNLSVGIRLVMSKKIFDGEGWLSSSSSSNIDGTTFKLEMSALDLFHKSKGLTTLVLESNIEDVIDSTRFSIIHESLSGSF